MESQTYNYKVVRQFAIMRGSPTAGCVPSTPTR